MQTRQCHVIATLPCCHTGTVGMGLWDVGPRTVVLSNGRQGLAKLVVRTLHEQLATLRPATPPDQCTAPGTSAQPLPDGTLSGTFSADITTTYRRLGGGINGFSENPVASLKNAPETSPPPIPSSVVVETSLSTFKTPPLCPRLCKVDKAGSKHLPCSSKLQPCGRQSVLDSLNSDQQAGLVGQTNHDIAYLFPEQTHPIRDKVTNRKRGRESPRFLLLPDRRLATQLGKQSRRLLRVLVILQRSPELAMQTQVSVAFVACEVLRKARPERVEPIQLLWNVEGYEKLQHAFGFQLQGIEVGAARTGAQHTHTHTRSRSTHTGGSPPEQCPTTST